MEAAKQDKRTVFVRGIAFSTGPEDFEAHFSELGPVRTSFLVKDRGQSGHKGFGFVQFALHEDAQKAAEQLHNTQFQGRKIKVEPAVKRAPLVDRKKRKLGELDSTAQPVDAAAKAEGHRRRAAGKEAEQDAAPSTQQQEPIAKPAKLSARASKKARKQKEGNKPAANPKQQLVRTVAVGSLQADTKQQAIAMAQAAGKVENILDPPSDLDISHARLKADGCTGEVVFVVYDSVKTALAAVAKLHGQPLAKEVKKDSKRQKVDKDGGIAVKPCLWARQVSGEGLHLKKWRLIIRNLSFQVKEADLKATLESGGSFVWDLSLPRNPEGALKGFGFATFTTRGHAESAIKTTNGKVVAGRQVVVDWAMAKARFTDAQATGSGEGVEPMHLPGALPMTDNAAHEQDGGHNDTAEEDEAAAADPDAERKMVQNVLDSLLQDFPDADEPAKAEPPATVAGQSKASKESDVSKPVKQTGSEVEAQQALPDVGSLPKAKVIEKGEPQKRAEQPATGVSSNTVFVRSLPPDVSQDQLQIAFKQFGKLRACRLVMNKESQQAKGTAFIEYWDNGAASAAAAVCQKARKGAAGGIMVGGRTVEVDLALSQDEARNLASGGKATTSGSKDNRNLYLAKEGTIEEGSAAWDSLSVTDRTKRKRAAEEKNTKLRSPNFSVSRTRLSVRNIPLTMLEKTLKQLFIAAVKEHASKAQPYVKQAKILRDPERVDPADGLPRSRGLGFVEFTEHEHAICALRQLNNNPAPFGRDKRPIVEFALESAQAVRKMATKQAWQKSQAQSQPPGNAAGAQQAKQASKPAAVPHKAEAVATIPNAKKARHLAKKLAAQQGVGPPSKAALNKVAPSKDRDLANSTPAKAAAPQGQEVAASRQQQAALGKSAERNPRKSAKQLRGPDKQLVERKRKADAALDDMAAQPSQGKQQQGSAKKGKSAKAEKGDKLDDMVASYKAKYFGTQVHQKQSGAKPAQKRPITGIGRWFE